MLTGQSGKEPYLTPEQRAKIEAEAKAEEERRAREKLILFLKI